MNAAGLTGGSWQDVPMGFYLMTILSIVFFIWSCFSNIAYWLINIPQYTIFGLQVWRLFLSYLICPDILFLLIALLLLYQLSTTDEIYIGTARYFLSLFTWSLALQVIVAVVGVILWLFFGLQTLSFGIWALYLMLLTIRCMKRPDESTSFCGFAILNRYYPMLWLLIMLPFNLLFHFQIDPWLGYLLGMAMSRWPGLKSALDPPLGLIMWLEARLRSLDGRSRLVNKFR